MSAERGLFLPLFIAPLELLLRGKIAVCLLSYVVLETTVHVSWCQDTS